MAVAKRKKGFTINFDLSLAGLLGVGVVCFCIFLWMFLLGVWSGQTVLISGKEQIAERKKPPVSTLQNVAKKAAPLEEKSVEAPAVVKAGPAPDIIKIEILGSPEKIVAKQSKEVVDPDEDPAFFAVQVAAFKDGALVGKELEYWKEKGYNPFSRPPEGPDDPFTRVYVGRFDSMEAARKTAGSLGEKEKIKPFIVLLPAG